MNTPIYKLALGDDFTKLAPELQEYFSLAAGSGYYGIGEGVFDVVGCKQKWLRPPLALTGREEAFFPEYGEGIRFRIENHAHVDPFGRPALTARREIYFPARTRLFHDTTSAVLQGNEGPGQEGNTQARLVDHVGRYRRLVTDLDVSVTAEGRLRGVSRSSRLLLGPLRIPLPAALDARAYAEQWWDSAEGKHRIQVKVIQPQVGLVLVYAGRFDYRLAPYLPGTAPGTTLPRYAEPDRWERRI
ncbi:DUF4166 domain-containing protein [Paenarthrobacter nicotinovorans]|uniref:DUF4166 domain-containing protein n=1 Tax=Paenarthrobacter nicotinovorans TaxID=29320 RepID=A0ABV0GVN9_PAENI|nr:DUF4166 domain-containing protein [Arthrobacter sp. StoSoilB20]BCW59472.1 hypothetical protein StoSoilB20_28190 [Arthrobacter sp. StoSoilB20]